MDYKEFQSWAKKHHWIHVTSAMRNKAGYWETWLSPQGNLVMLKIKLGDFICDAKQGEARGLEEWTLS